MILYFFFFFFSSRRRHTRLTCDWSSDVCSSDLNDGRPVLSTGGSSSGAGTAANLWTANVGTDTAGSVVNPAALTMLVGIRPTTGRISRHGIIPIKLDQDTAGPMARTVTDAAILLGALESPAPDPNDPATTRCTPPAG